MFVSVCCDLGSDDHLRAVDSILTQYGFKKIMASVYESTSLMEKNLARLKRDLDRATDYYDHIRLYQYPLKNEMVVSSLANKKWRRYVLKDSKE